MFGFGFSKLAVLVGIVIAVWYGFKLVGRLDQARKQQQRGVNPTTRAGGAAAPEVEDTVQCPVCKAYVVAKSAGPCDRPDCPY